MTKCAGHSKTRCDAHPRAHAGHIAGTSAGREESGPSATDIGQAMAPHPKLQKHTHAASAERLLDNHPWAAQADRPSKLAMVCARCGILRRASPRAKVEIIPNMRGLGIQKLQHSIKLHMSQCIKANGELIPNTAQTTHECPRPVLHIACNGIPTVIKGHLPVKVVGRQSSQIVSKTL